MQVKSEDIFPHGSLVKIQRRFYFWENGFFVNSSWHVLTLLSKTITFFDEVFEII